MPQGGSGKQGGNLGSSGSGKKKMSSKSRRITGNRKSAQKGVGGEAVAAEGGEELPRAFAALPPPPEKRAALLIAQQRDLEVEEELFRVSVSHRSLTLIPNLFLPVGSHFVVSIPATFFSFLVKTLGLTPVVSIFEIDLSCFLLIFLIFFVSVICGTRRTVSERRPRQGGRGTGTGAAQAHHLVRHALLLVLLLS